VLLAVLSLGYESIYRFDKSFSVKLMSTDQLQSEGNATVTKSSAAIVVLTTAEFEDIEALSRNFGALGNALPNSNAPVLVFHEGDLTTQQMDNLTTILHGGGYSGEVHFPIVNLELPEGCCDFEPLWTKRTPFGYQNMIRFWIKDLWNHPAIVDGGFETVMRLDTDSIIYERQPDDDLIPSLPPHLVYRGNTMNEDSGDVIQHFGDFMNKILESWTPQNRELIELFKGTWNSREAAPGIFNNFFIARTEFFRRTKVKELVDMMCCRPPDFFVYRYRWGDAIIHLFLLAMEADPDEYVIQPPVGYVHVG
jgi:hypothetical protein